MIEIVFATNNPNKLEEVQAQLIWIALQMTLD